MEWRGAYTVQSHRKCCEIISLQSECRKSRPSFNIFHPSSLIGIPHTSSRTTPDTRHRATRQTWHNVLQQRPSSANRIEHKHLQQFSFLYFAHIHNSLKTTLAKVVSDKEILFTKSVYRLSRSRNKTNKKYKTNDSHLHEA